MADKVVDASALAAILFEEPEGNAVAIELGGHRLIAPALLPFEVGNVCVKKMRAHPTERDAILARFSKYIDFPIALFPIDASAMAETAALLGLSAYDASYLLLAKQRRAELITLDAKLEKAAAKI